MLQMSFGCCGATVSTNRLSKVIDIHLQPLPYKIKSYIRNYIHFLNSIPQKTDPNTFMVTFDVTNLYSNIPWNQKNRTSYFEKENIEKHYTQDLTKT